MRGPSWFARLAGAIRAGLDLVNAAACWLAFPAAGRSPAQLQHMPLRRKLRAPVAPSLREIGHSPGPGPLRSSAPRASGLVTRKQPGRELDLGAHAPWHAVRAGPAPGAPAYDSGRPLSRSRFSPRCRMHAAWLKRRQSPNLAIRTSEIRHHRKQSSESQRD
jgi:hypothetical protein